MNNMTTTNKENKLDKLVRLLKKYEDELGVVDGVVSIVLNSDGSGTVFAPYGNEVDNTTDIDMPVFDFTNTGILVTFLEATHLRRSLMIREK